MLDVGRAERFFTGPRQAALIAQEDENARRVAEGRAEAGRIAAERATREDLVKIAKTLGLPTTGDTAVNGGWFNHFQGGSIYFSNATGAQIVKGAIRDKWAAQGWETGRLEHFPDGISPRSWSRVLMRCLSSSAGKLYAPAMKGCWVPGS